MYTKRVGGWYNFTMFNFTSRNQKKKSIIGILFIFLLFIFAPSLAMAEFSNIPNVGVPTTNGTINTIVEDPVNSDIVYLGGSFTRVTSDTGYGARISTVTGDVIAPAALSAVKVNGTINVSVSDGAGGFYIGGSFTKVGTITRNNIAHILADGSLDQNFDPNADNLVKAFALSSDGSILYVGGYFTHISGGTKVYVAALNTATGLATSLDLNASEDSGNHVSALALSSDDSTLYVGGQFLLSEVNLGTISLQLTRRLDSQLPLIRVQLE